MAEAGGLMIGGARDPAETRADARAAKALSAAPIVHRECAACAADERQSARRRRSTAMVALGNAAAPAPKRVKAAVNALGPGRPLASQERAFFETRMDADFSPVRLHETAAANAAAEAMGASAFTLGRDIAFAEGERRRGGPALLAHELAHVAEDAPEARRKLTVMRPGQDINRPGGKGAKQTNGETIEKYLNEICFLGVPKVKPTGEVAMDEPFVCDIHYGQLSSGCDCVCDLIRSKNDWTVEVRDSPKANAWPHTLPKSGKRASNPKSGGSGGAIVVPSPNDTMEYGLAGVGGKINIGKPWAVLAHEMCGHARLSDVGKHPKESKKHLRHGHEKVVAATNKIREEYIFENIPLRGSRVQDPYCGESFSRRKGSAKWKPSAHINACKRLRSRYLKRMRKAHPGDPVYKKKYRLKDTLP